MGRTGCDIETSQSKDLSLAIIVCGKPSSVKEAEKMICTDLLTKVCLGGQQFVASASFFGHCVCFSKKRGYFVYIAKLLFLHVVHCQDYCAKAASSCGAGQTRSQAASDRGVHQH